MHKQVLKLSEILERWKPGSYDATGWSWDDEERDILARECLCCDQPGHYQYLLTEYIRVNGIESLHRENPILLGDDDRVWDGHHRLIICRQLGIEDIPFEQGVTIDAEAYERLKHI